MLPTPNLFILGNGFDLAHNLPTKYSDFRAFMIKRCEEYGIELFENGLFGPKLVKKCPRLPGLQIHYTDKNGEGRVLAEYYQEAAVLLWLIESAAKTKTDKIKDWSDFEEVIMKLRYLPLLSSGFDENELAIEALRETIYDLPGFFAEWVASIEIPDGTRLNQLQSIMNPKEDLALTFNYTETLEKLYGFSAENSCHIHGKRKETIPKEYAQQYLWSFGEDDKTLVVGGKVLDNPNDPYLIIRNGLGKDTDCQIVENKSFFEKILDSQIENIYSYGYSFSEVDQPYIAQVCKSLGDTREKTWTTFLYNKKDSRRISKALKEAGFEGKIIFEDVISKG